jgi:diguanylate cyclase (GGDEF)-like protein/PAS domain S-box-containing protein
MELTGDFYKEVLDNADIGIYFVDRDRKIVYWNKGAERITGYSTSDVLNRRCADNILVHIDEDCNSLCTGGCPLACAVSDGSVRSAEVYLHHKSGHRVPVAVTVTPIRDSEGKIIGAVETFRDISTGIVDKMILEDLKKAASVDPLTELPNRRFIETRLRAGLEELKRHGLSFGIIFGDIDQFKEVNDAYGHVVGDNVLKMVSLTLSENVRAYDMAGRWGGEEFLIVISHVGGRTLINMADKLRRLVKKSFVKHDDSLISVTITMGATMACPEDSIESLVKRADELMYAGKTAGRNCLIHDVQDIDK